MSNKKSDEAGKSPELQELEQRVDAMMSTEQPKDKAAKVTAVPAKKTSSLRIISDYPGNQKTAPKLPAKLLKNITAEAPAAAAPPEPAAEPEPEKPPAEPVPVAPAEVEEPPSEPIVSTDNLLENSETDRAVEDIVIHEGDTQLAVDDAIAKRKAAEADNVHGPGLISRFFSSPWTWLFIIGIAAVTYAWYH
jgi:hypothetical protein